MQKSNTVVRLRERPPDQRLVAQLEQLLVEARSGAIVGLLAGVHYGGKEYGYIGTGSVVDHPEIGLAISMRLRNRCS